MPGHPSRYGAARVPHPRHAPRCRGSTPDHATRFLLHIAHDDKGMALTMTTE